MLNGAEIEHGRYVYRAQFSERALVETPTSSRRVRFRELLSLLASEEEQLAYERNVPHVDITAELVCMWFDDLYDTGQAATDFTFSDGERAALAEFHQFYDARVKRLPKMSGHGSHLAREPDLARGDGAGAEDP